MAALAVLGAGGRARAEGYPTFAAGIQDADGRWLLHLADDSESMTRAWGVHRQRLHNALLASAEGAELLTGVQVTHLRPQQRLPAATRAVLPAGLAPCFAAQPRDRAADRLVPRGGGAALGPVRDRNRGQPA